MSVPISPLGEYVVVQNEEASNRTQSGLYIPESATEKPSTAKVVALGPKAKHLKVGDKVIYKNDYQDTTTVKIGTEEYVILPESNVIATVK